MQISSEKFQDNHLKQLVVTQVRMGQDNIPQKSKKRGKELEEH